MRTPHAPTSCRVTLTSKPHSQSFPEQHLWEQPPQKPPLNLPAGHSTVVQTPAAHQGVLGMSTTAVSIAAGANISILEISIAFLRWLPVLSRSPANTWAQLWDSSVPPLLSPFPCAPIQNHSADLPENPSPSLVASATLATLELPAQRTRKLPQILQMCFLLNKNDSLG